MVSALTLDGLTWHCPRLAASRGKSQSFDKGISGSPYIGMT